MGVSPATRPHVRHTLTWRHRLANWRGTPVRVALRDGDADLERIAALEPQVARLSDADLLGRAASAHARVRHGAALAEVRHEWFALAREAAQRALGQRPFDEQVLAALGMSTGWVVEMQTGEGKTLAAVLPASLHALTGRGAHVLTFNDYLAARDAAWMQPVYERLGLRVGCVQQSTPRDDRRAAYSADVTYLTSKEAGFDLLRDLLACEPRDVVQRGFAFGLVDEADSLLIDEARVPMVLACRDAQVPDVAPPDLAALVATLSPGQHYDTDEYQRDVELSDAGLDAVERALGRGPLHAPHNLALLTAVNCALHAHVLLRRDVDYLVRGGRVEIIDEFTGRVVADRHWPDGLQSALEAKEGQARRPDGRVLASLTVGRFFSGYAHLCGMTGTAESCADELHALYGVDVLLVPTHRPVIRLDHPDLVFTHREAKLRALVEEIGRACRARRPVLVGTLTVDESEHLAGRLRALDVPCRVLNAKHDAAEAAIVADAGLPGAVTIATNMAGRGTDIKLGGATQAHRDEVVALGGLYVIGTSRHESRRIDLQLRGRAGRQGDPGESRFFVALDDHLLVRYGLDALVPARLRPAHQDAPLPHPIIRREIARAQRIVEGQHFETRGTLARYAAVLEHQHREVMARRRAVLDGDEVPRGWEEAPQRRASLVAAVGEAEVRRAERRATLSAIDRAWSNHLGTCAELREGIHLVRLGGREPLERFTVGAIESYHRLDDEIDALLMDALGAATVADGRIDLGAWDPATPGATWTYLVNDDPFERQMGSLLTGAGGRSVAIYSAVVLMPLFLAWTIAGRWFGRAARRKAGPDAASPRATGNETE